MALTQAEAQGLQASADAARAALAALDTSINTVAEGGAVSQFAFAQQALALADAAVKLAISATFAAGT